MKSTSFGDLGPVPAPIALRLEPSGEPAALQDITYTEARDWVREIVLSLPTDWSRLAEVFRRNELGLLAEGAHISTLTWRGMPLAPCWRWRHDGESTTQVIRAILGEMLLGERGVEHRACITFAQTVRTWIPVHDSASALQDIRYADSAPPPAAETALMAPPVPVSLSDQPTAHRDLHVDPWQETRDLRAPSALDSLDPFADEPTPATRVAMPPAPMPVLPLRVVEEATAAAAAAVLPARPGATPAMRVTLRELLLPVAEGTIWLPALGASLTLEHVVWDGKLWPIADFVRSARDRATVAPGEEE